MIEILNKNKDFIAIYKPAGMPSQPDHSGDKDAMSAASEVLEELGEPTALWPVHRLDRVVGGVLIFARSKIVASNLSELVGGVNMEKEYLAVVHGEAQGGLLVDFLYKDARLGKAFIVKEGKSGAKRAELEYFQVETAKTENGTYSLVRVKLHTGRFHQIRTQFSSRGNPIVGDGKYGSRDNNAKLPALFASGLAFDYKNERVNIYKYPDTDLYPWSLYKWSSIK